MLSFALFILLLPKQLQYSSLSCLQVLQCCPATWLHTGKHQVLDLCHPDVLATCTEMATSVTLSLSASSWPWLLSETSATALQHCQALCGTPMSPLTESEENFVWTTWFRASPRAEATPGYPCVRVQTLREPWRVNILLLAELQQLRQRSLPQKVEPGFCTQSQNPLFKILLCSRSRQSSPSLLPASWLCRQACS